jgi:hypothetical protein
MLTHARRSHYDISHIYHYIYTSNLTSHSRTTDLPPALFLDEVHQSDKPLHQDSLIPNPQVDHMGHLKPVSYHWWY